MPRNHFQGDNQRMNSSSDNETEATGGEDLYGANGGNADNTVNDGGAVSPGDIGSPTNADRDVLAGDQGTGDSDTGGGDPQQVPGSTVGTGSTVGPRDTRLENKPNSGGSAS